MKLNSACKSCRRRGVSRKRHRRIVGRRGVIIMSGVTTGKSSHNASNARGVTACKMGRNSSIYNSVVTCRHITINTSSSERASERRKAKKIAVKKGSDVGVGPEL